MIIKIIERIPDSAKFIEIWVKELSEPLETDDGDIFLFKRLDVTDGKKKIQRLCAIQGYAYSGLAASVYCTPRLATDFLQYLEIGENRKAYDLLFGVKA